MMTHRRPRLLFLSQTLPYPPDGGVNIRTYNLMRILAREFEVTSLCFFRRSHRPTPEAVQSSIDGLREVGPAEAFPLPQEHSRIRFARDHLRSVIHRRVYTVFSYDSRAFRRRLRTVLDEGDFDLVHLGSLDLSSYLGELRGLPWVCDHHNAESALLRRRAEMEQSWHRRHYLLHQAALMEEEERQWCGRAALNLTVSDADRTLLQSLAPDGRFLTVPNGVDTTKFRPAEGDGRRGIVFVGGCSWFPNRDALGYFAEEILPHIRTEYPNVPVTWVGRAPEETRRRYKARHGIDLTGYVDDIRPYVRRAACYVVPLRVGGGTRLKVLDAWAMGKAVVTTSRGSEGLDVRDGENAVVRDSAKEFAAAVLNVLREGELRDRLGANGRRTVEQVYDWDVIGRQLLPVYTTLSTTKEEGTDGRLASASPVNPADA